MYGAAVAFGLRPPPYGVPGAQLRSPTEGMNANARNVPDSLTCPSSPSLGLAAPGTYARVCCPEANSGAAQLRFRIRPVSKTLLFDTLADAVCLNRQPAVALDGYAAYPFRRTGWRAASWFKLARMSWLKLAVIMLPTNERFSLGCAQVSPL
jgi:hypothetical protein